MSVVHERSSVLSQEDFEDLAHHAIRTAKIPVYVIVDRKSQRVHVLTDPFANEYDSHRVHAPGEEITLPGSVSDTPVTLSVADLLATGRRR